MSTRQFSRRDLGDERTYNAERQTEGNKNVTDRSKGLVRSAVIHADNAKEEQFVGSENPGVAECNRDGHVDKQYHKHDKTERQMNHVPIMEDLLYLFKSEELGCPGLDQIHSQIIQTAGFTPKGNSQ